MAGGATAYFYLLILSLGDPMPCPERKDVVLRGHLSVLSMWQHVA
jgi:hypothetical protein